MIMTPLATTPITTNSSSISLSSEKETESLETYLSHQPLSPAQTKLIIHEFTPSSPSPNINNNNNNNDNPNEIQTHGEIKFKSGDTYLGSLTNNFMHGTGTYTFSDSTIASYTGTFDYNVITGSGKYVWTDGSVYEGGVINGIRNGYGSFVESNGVVTYTGDWVNGQRHGTGTIFYSSTKKSHYSGKWSNNKRSGSGTVVYESGNIYIGEWKDDVKSGHGVMNWYSKNEQYTGEWKLDVPNGTGVHLYTLPSPPPILSTSTSLTMLMTSKSKKDLLTNPRLNSYSGSIENGLFNKLGKFSYSNGSIYYGHWVDGIKHGWGCFVSPDGSFIEGTFVDDIMPARMSTNPFEGKRGRVSDDVKVHVKLDLSGVLTVNDNDASGRNNKLVKMIENSTLIHHVGLKAVYIKYSSMLLPMVVMGGKGGDPSDDVCFNMNYNQLRSFLNDSGLLEQHELSFVEIMDMLSSIRQRKACKIIQNWEVESRSAAYDAFFSEEGIGSELKGKYDGRNTVSYNEFIEVIIRVSITSASAGSEGGSVDIKALYVNAIEDSVLPLTQPQPLADSSVFSDYVRCKEFGKVSGGYYDVLSAVFLTYASGGDAECSIGNTTMRTESFASLSKDCGEVGDSESGSDESLSYVEFLEGLVKLSVALSKSEEEAQKTREEYSVIFEEFVRNVLTPLNDQNRNGGSEEGKRGERVRPPRLLS